MSVPITRTCRRCLALIVAAGLLQWTLSPASADELTDFQAAVAELSDQYNMALTTLETRGQVETAAEVGHLRQSWHDFVERFGARRPKTFADDASYTAALIDVDMRLIGVLLVIDLGNRDAARAGLRAVHDMIYSLTAQPPSP